MSIWIAGKDLMKHNYQVNNFFYSELNLEGITDEDYVHAQNARNVFKMKNLGEYHDLYVQSDTLLLSDIFEKFRDTCIKKYMNSTLQTFYLHLD